MQLLEDDAKVFKAYLETNKNQTREEVNKAEEETKKKGEKITEYKQLQENHSTIMSTNTKKLEILDKLFQYKVFLDDLAEKLDEDFKKKRTLKRK